MNWLDYQRARRQNTCTSVVAAILCLVTVYPVALSAQSVLAESPSLDAQNSLLAAVTNVGVKQCRSQLLDISSLAVQGTRNNDVLFDWNHKRPNSGPVFSLIGLNYGSKAAALSIAAVPDVDGSCSIAAERISVASAPCKAIADKDLKGYRATPLLETMTVYADEKDLGSTVSLIDSPPGCLVIRRYITFSKASGTR